LAICQTFTSYTAEMEQLMQIILPWECTAASRRNQHNQEPHEQTNLPVATTTHT